MFVVELVVNMSNDSLVAFVSLWASLKKSPMSGRHEAQNDISNREVRYEV